MSRWSVGFLAVFSAFGAPAAAASPAPLDPELAKSSQEISAQIESAGLLLGDQALDAYLQSVADRLHSSNSMQGTSTIRVRAIKGALPNAFALPDGAIYVTTELLIRLRNESQLATVLGHELAHYSERHAQRQQRVENRRNTFSSMLTMIVAGLAGSALGSTSVAQSLIAGTEGARQTWLLASMSGYSQELEREADQLGFQRMQAAGFDATQAPGVFDALDDASTEGQQASRPKFASHPVLSERRASYAALVIGERPAVNSDDAGDWQARIGDLSLRQLDVKLEQRDYVGGLALAEGVARKWPNYGRVDFLTGEFLRLDRRADSLALDAYLRAVTKPDCPADAWRQIGYLHRRNGDDAKAAEAFSRYLQLVPGAAEAPLLRDFIGRTAAPAPSIRVDP